MVDGYFMATVDSDYTNIYIKNELAVGRVEVCVDGTFVPLCQNELWNNQSVSVVCFQLGFSRYGEEILIVQ